MNFLKEMMLEVCLTDMKLVFEFGDDEIKRKIKEIDMDTVRAFFAPYTIDELLDIIEQTDENLNQKGD